MDDRLDEKDFTNCVHEFIIRSFVDPDFKDKDYGRYTKSVYRRNRGNFDGQ